jgi:hypothetical protein
MRSSASDIGEIYSPSHEIAGLIKDIIYQCLVDSQNRLRIIERDDGSTGLRCCITSAIDLEAVARCMSWTDDKKASLVYIDDSTSNIHKIGDGVRICRIEI